MKISVQELRRQIFHFALGPVIILLFKLGLLSLTSLFIILIAGSVFAVIASRWKVPGITWFLANFDRPDSGFPGEGAVFYVLGCFIVLGIFPDNIAMGAIMVLAAGDSLATLIGRSIGRRKLREKTVEGFMAGTAAAFLGALLFVDVALAFFGSLGAMLFEAIELKVFRKKLDDNLFIPVIAGIIMYGVSLL